MRFSVRTIFLAIVFIALVLATIVSAVRLHNAQHEIARRREAYGVGGLNRYQLSLVGGSFNLTGVSLVRLENPEDYILEAVFYDGGTLKTKRESIPLPDPEFAIRYDESGEVFLIQSTTPFKKALQRRFRVSGEESFWLNPLESRSKIDGNPFLFYFFRPRTRDAPNAAELDHLTSKVVIEVCQKYKIKCVYFRFVKR